MTKQKNKKISIEKVATKMDRLGVIVFTYIIFYSILAINKEANIMNILLLLIGLGGFLVDSFIVIKTHINSNRLKK